jgi:starch phosphorylase
MPLPEPFQNRPSGHSILLRDPKFRNRPAFPERFNNKTNGVTPRRWLLMANPFLSRASKRRISYAR